MSNDDPVTLWLDGLRNVDDVAAGKLWNHFAQRLYVLARDKLRPDTRRVYDEEDVVLSAFHSFCAGVMAGRFPDLQDREGLWRLLISITARKVSHRHRFDHQQRRDVRRHHAPTSISEAEVGTSQWKLDHLPSCEPSPEFSTEFIDVCDHLMKSLADPDLQWVAALRIEGFQDAEIATQLGCSRSTVQRRLEIIRRNWQRMELTSE